MQEMRQTCGQNYALVYSLFHLGFSPWFERDAVLKNFKEINFVINTTRSICGNLATFCLCSSILLCFGLKHDFTFSCKFIQVIPLKTLLGVRTLGKSYEKFVLEYIDRTEYPVVAVDRISFHLHISRIWDPTHILFIHIGPLRLNTIESNITQHIFLYKISTAALTFSPPSSLGVFIYWGQPPI